MKFEKSTDRCLTTNSVKITQQCISCEQVFDMGQMLDACQTCHAPLEYVVDGHFSGPSSDRDDLWKFFDLLPLKNRANIVSCGEGDSQVIALDELTDMLKGTKLYLKLDMMTAPTGTFKDREASVIISRCKENGLDNLVVHSTGNTGRAYTHYAAQLGLTSYLFMPKECQYKNTNSFKKNKNNFIILVDGNYPQISPYKKAFAKAHGLNPVGPLHDRTESYATLAYEQFQQMPNCTFVAQTIASGMGPVGFYRGHKNLIKFGLEEKEQMPRLICIQSTQMNAICKAFQQGKKTLSDSDVPMEFSDDLFEPTLNSTNPANNYPQVRECLIGSNGVITDVDADFVMEVSPPLIAALEQRGVYLETELEKSILIGYAGLVRLADEGVYQRGDTVMLIGTGRAGGASKELVPADAVVDPAKDDPADLKKILDAKLNR